MKLIGIDIGGTKCAVSLGETVNGGGVHVLHRCEARRSAGTAPADMLAALSEDAKACIALAGENMPVGIGISCGGPLDSRNGVILSPPNLPGWDAVQITSYLEQAIGLPARLCNDANACALAEWKMGAGQGCENMVFLTFGTGLGAGLILNGQLYEGASDMAGELGHIRLAVNGPVGYGKTGSFEGFCSGGGIAQLAKSMVLEQLQQGKSPALCPTAEQLEALTAERVGNAAKGGDPLAKAILGRVGEYLGQGLSILIDLLNPERIVIGSIFARCQDEIWPSAQRVIERETLPAAREACAVLPCALKESVGDIAALMVAAYQFGNERENHVERGNSR